MEDIGAHAVKTGMLANAAIIEAVAAKVEQHRFKNLVVDPVMVATSGDLLIKKNAVARLRARFCSIRDSCDAQFAGSRRAHRHGATHALSDRRSSAANHQHGQQRPSSLKAVIAKDLPWICFLMAKNSGCCGRRASHSRNTHGTGCTFLRRYRRVSWPKAKRIERRRVAAPRSISPGDSRRLYHRRGTQPGTSFLSVLGEKKVRIEVR